MSHPTEPSLIHAQCIANAVLYEGYILYPYSASSVKNQQRFTFGGVYPRVYSESQCGSDLCAQQTQLLVRGNENTQLAFQVRFLHLVHRHRHCLEVAAKPGARS